MVDDRDWHAVLARLAYAVRPGGVLVLIDKLPEGEAQLYGSYVRHRTRAEVVEGFARHGFRFASEFSRGNLHLAWRT